MLSFMRALAVSDACVQIDGLSKRRDEPDVFVLAPASGPNDTAVFETSTQAALPKIICDSMSCISSPLAQAAASKSG
jgi:hypothetical protein